MLLVLGFALICIHFGVPVGYFGYLRWTSDRSLGLRTDPSYEPIVSIIVPTYNEEELIIRKLEDIMAQGYPKDRLSIIVADDCSQDKTRERVKVWINSHPEVEATMVTQQSHTGKMPMVRGVLEQEIKKADLIILTDVDAFWDNDAISNAARYFADTTVGSVTCTIEYSEEAKPIGEKTYRELFNDLHIAESKVFATPVQNGPFLALRLSALREYGLPDFEGIDDSALGSFFAFCGLRAIQAPDVRVWEPSRGNLFRKKTRRANRLIMNFMKTKKCAIRRGLYERTAFEKIWKVEWWLHIANPWLLITGALLLIVSLFTEASLLAMLLLLVGAALSVFSPYRSWMIQQFYLIAGRVRNLKTSDITWQR